MRKQFIVCYSRSTAHRLCPWAARVVKVEGGFLCFESVSDYAIWLNQR